MTFSDDELRFQFEGGVFSMRCAALGIDWPPPALLEIFGFTMRLHRRSMLTDEQRAAMPNVIRGAEYILEIPKEH